MVAVYSVEAMMNLRTQLNKEAVFLLIAHCCRLTLMSHSTSTSSLPLWFGFLQLHFHFTELKVPQMMMMMISSRIHRC